MERKHRIMWASLVFEMLQTFEIRKGKVCLAACEELTTSVSQVQVQVQVCHKYRLSSKFLIKSQIAQNF